MRNLKRALSLGLTAAMISGLMVMGSSAASSYTDVADTDNVEAIEVLKTVGIMIGDESGDFNPDQNVTRNEMAVVMANLMEYNVASYKDTSPFTDVPSWAEPYVAACWTNGITAGYSDTIYGGSDTVTTAQAALMLMKALGYFQYASDFGSDWQLATTRQGNAIDLFDGVDSGVTAPMTRNDVAQLVLNTLEAGTVTASTDGSWSIGDIVINNNVTYNYVTSNADYAESIHKVQSTDSNTDAGRSIVELGEQLYQGDLRLREGTTDDFGRPSRTWSYENSEIGTYADTPDLTYTAKVEAGDIYKDLGLGSSVNKNNVTVYVNGVEEDDLALSIRKGSDDKVGESANGVLTEVYYDEEADTVLVAQIHTYVGTVVRTVEATDNRDAYVVIAPEAPIGTGLTAPISGNEQFETDEDFDDEAYVLYTYSESADEIKSVQLAEEVTGTVTRAENDRQNEEDAKALTIDGTRYTDSLMVAGEKLGDISVDEEYIVYLDSYGYMIYVERIDEIGDYALLYNIDSGSLFNSNKAALIFADGTSAIVNTAEDYSEVEELNYDFNGDGKVDSTDQTGWDSSYGSRKAPVIVTYRVDKDNVYTLRAARGYQGVSNTYGASNASVGETDMLLVNNKAGITGLPVDPVTANSATTFVIRDPETRNYNKIGDWTSYVGIKNAPSIDIRDLDNTTTRTAANESSEMADVYYYCKNGRMVTIMFVVPDAEVVVEDGVNKNIYLSSRDVSNLIHDTNYSVSYYEYNAVVDGEPTTVMVASDVKVNGATQSEIAAGQLSGIYGRYTTNKDGIITSLTSGTAYTSVNDESGIINGLAGIDKVSKEYTILVGKNASGYDYTITVDEDADIFYVDVDGDVNVSSYSGIAIDDDDLVYAVVDDYMVQTLVIFEVDTTNDARGSVSVTPTGTINAVVGDASVVLTANATGATTRDEIVSYQWYSDNNPADNTVNSKTGAVSNATKLNGETGRTLTISTAQASNTYYFCVVEFYNDRVTGQDTVYVGSSNAVQVVVSEAPIADMKVRVSYRLSDGTEVAEEIRTVPATSANGDNEVVVAVDLSKITGYSIKGLSSKTIEYQAGERVTVEFTVELTNYSLTVAPDAVPGGYTTSGAPATATYGQTVTLTVTANDNSSGKQAYTSCEVAGIPATVQFVNDGDGSSTPAVYKVTFTMPAQNLNVGTGAINNWKL